MSDDAPLGTFEEQVMVAVLRTGEEAYGMAVRREIEAVIGRDVTIGAVYATLDRLEAKRLVASRRTAGEASVASLAACASTSSPSTRRKARNAAIRIGESACESVARTCASPSPPIADSSHTARARTNGFASSSNAATGATAAAPWASSRV